MLFGYSKHNERNFEKHYVDARRKVDILCGLIVSERLPEKDAMEIYGEIESEFAARDPGKAELFEMIYKNRVVRLCDQFCRN
jgi:hypothetical protein